MPLERFLLMDNYVVVTSDMLKEVASLLVCLCFVSSLLNAFLFLYIPKIVAFVFGEKNNE